MRGSSTSSTQAFARWVLPAVLCTLAACSSPTSSSLDPDGGAADSGSPAQTDGGTPPQSDAGSPTPDGGGSAITSRPNDGTGYWPDSTNTGYQNAPDYPGQLTDFPQNRSGYTYLDESYDGQTIRFRHFHGKVMIGSTGGSTPSGVAHITFYGCLFEGTLPEDLLVYDFTTVQSTYQYSTFKPEGVTAPPVSCDQSYEISVNQSNTQAITMDHCDIWGGAGIQFGASSQERPLVFTNNYIHDEADPDNEGGCNYHHDGIGPCSEGGISYVTIDHNTIASRGNTNGIALQGNQPYDHISITNNYISGWGYAVSIGAGETAASDTNVTVTGNVFSGEFPALYGPLYGGIPPGPGSVWQDNRYQVRSGDAWGDPASNGQYWWPTDDVGHSADYP